MYGAERTAWTWGKSYEEIVGSGDTRLFIRGEGAEFEERYKRENVLKAFERGERWSSRELRVVDSGGNIRWVADTVNLQKDPVTGDIYMFCCFNDIQERHEWENLLEEGVEREGLGLPYTPQTIRRLCGKLIERGGETLCYVVLIRMIGGLELLDGRIRRRDCGCGIFWRRRCPLPWEQTASSAGAGRMSFWPFSQWRHPVRHQEKD